MQLHSAQATRPGVPERTITRTLYSDVALALGAAFFGLVAAIHGLTATASGSIPWLAALWLFVPAPVVFVWQAVSARRRHGAVAGSRRWRWLGKSYLVLAAVLSVAVLGGVGWIGSQRALHPEVKAYKTLADFPALQSAAEAVSFQVPGDGRRMGWFIPGRSQATILLLHGYGARREGMLDHAAVLHQAGYSVLLFDFRNRGESDGDAVSLGFHETQDAVAAVHYLSTRRDVDQARLGVLGESMGASVAILAASQMPEIQAVIADSGFQSAAKAIEEGFTRSTGLPRLPYSPITLAIIRLRLGISPGDIVPQGHIRAISPRPILLIHGLADTSVSPGNSRALFAAAGEPKQLWLLPNSQHTEGIRDYREEYASRIVQFFDLNLQ